MKIHFHLAKISYFSYSKNNRVNIKLTQYNKIVPTYTFNKRTILEKLHIFSVCLYAINNMCTYIINLSSFYK